MSWRLVGLLLVFSRSMLAAESSPSPKAETGVEVECHGKLRHGVVAIGGETTGTTVSFGGLIWELKLPDEKSGEFAKTHHRQPVTVVGKLRHVAGTERKDRWIVDVSQLSERDTKVKDDGATISVCGSLQQKAPPAEGKSEFVLAAGDTNWPLSVAEKPELQTKAVSLVSKTVVVKGHVECAKDQKNPGKMIIGATTIETAKDGQVKPK